MGDWVNSLSPLAILWLPSITPGYPPSPRVVMAVLGLTGWPAKDPQGPLPTLSSLHQAPQFAL